ncbi:MAG: alpha-glucosidase [Cyclobacteriaceae bacterium]|nr:alpha-glucosidase [Cyclobacteriaceae bacterium]
MNEAWYKQAIVYQIYPRSFCDSNGDGTGDLRGVISKLDYIQSLGVDAVWINPIYLSPNDDGGYDISDYYTIQPEFGTMSDLDELLEGLHARGLKLIMDLVLNHSSDEHAWFVESRKSTGSPKRDYYFWREGKNGGPPNNWPSFFGGSAWEKDPATGAYYLHLFSRKQPDLNWEHEDLRKEVRDLMEFWLKKGVDGLRLDVISAISKRTDFPDTDTTNFNETIRRYYANGPRLKEFIAEMRHSVWDRYQVMTVGEGPGITPDNALEYLDEKDGLSMIFHFGHMFMDQGPGGRFDPIPWTLSGFKQVFALWNKTFEHRGWGSVFLGNHDFGRMVSRWGNDREHHNASSKLLLTLLLTQRGTPFIYQGDEIGMTNYQLRAVSESRDIETLNGWRDAQQRGLSEAEFLKAANYAGRDNARTPVQWDDSAFAGFSGATPWMPVNSNKSGINVAQQETEQGSILNYFRQLAKLRKQHPAFSFGNCTTEDVGVEAIFLYRREYKGDKMMVLLNLSDESQIWPLEAMDQQSEILMSNYADRRYAGSDLRPWEAVILKG